MLVSAGLTLFPGNLAWFQPGFNLVWLVPARGGTVAGRSSPVSRADGTASKLPVQPCLHGREGVQPFEPGFPGFPRLKSLVQ
jgi:hypothetical protein